MWFTQSIIHKLRIFYKKESTVDNLFIKSDIKNTECQDNTQPELKRQEFFFEFYKKMTQTLGPKLKSLICK